MDQSPNFRSDIFPGGACARLWLASGEQHLKPLRQLPDEQNPLDKTFSRAATLLGVDQILTVTNCDLVFKTKDVVPCNIGWSDID